MNQHKRIFIIGHPGAGKGLLAKTVADKLGWNFISSDLELEFRIGKYLDEILCPEGVKSFYNCESEIIQTQLAKEHIVVATDASIVSSEKNRQLLSSEFVVYLKVSTPVQIERTSRNADSLLKNPDLSAFFNKLHRERDELYEQASSLIINSDNNTFDEHVRQIINNISAEPGSRKSTLNNKELILFHKQLHTPINLTDQQASCLKQLSQGKSSKQIAREMGISYRTVEGTIAKIMEISGCTNSKELIALYHDKP